MFAGESNFDQPSGSQNSPWIANVSDSPHQHSTGKADHMAHSPSNRPLQRDLGAGGDDTEEYSSADTGEDSDEFVDEDDASDAAMNQVSPVQSKSPGPNGRFRLNRPNKRARLSTSSVSTPRSAGRPRRVDADLNSDDEIIYNMKERGYKDELVRDELIRQGRIRYVAKTISTRYGRIKRALEARETEELDANLTDWHDGDDELLHAAYAEVLPAIEEQRAALDRKMWSEVATTLKRHMAGKPRFSKNACRDRFLALRDGTAEPTLEQDPDQDGRLARRAERALHRDKARAEASKHAELTAGERLKREAAETTSREERANKAASRARRTADKKRHRESLQASRAAEQKAKIAMLEAKEYEKARKVTLAEQEREAKKREAAAFKIEKQREKEMQAELRKARNAADKAEKAREKLRAAEAKMKKIEAEQNIKDIMKRHMSQALASSRATSVTPNVNLDVDEYSENESSPPPLGLFPRAQRASMAQPLSRWHPATASTEAGSVSGDVPGQMFDRGGSVFSVPDAGWDRATGGVEDTRSIEVPNFPRPDPPPPDPRATLSLEDLQALCHRRQIPFSGSADVLATRLANADNEMHIHQLRAELKKRGVSANGSKAELVYRSAACDAGLWVNPGRDTRQQTTASISMAGYKRRNGPDGDNGGGSESYSHGRE